MITASRGVLEMVLKSTIFIPIDATQCAMIDNGLDEL